MSKKQFSLETKIKYVRLILKIGLEDALIYFIVEFDKRYESYLDYKGKKR